MASGLAEHRPHHGSRGPSPPWGPGPPWGPLQSSITLRTQNSEIISHRTGFPLFPAGCGGACLESWWSRIPSWAWRCRFTLTHGQRDRPRVLFTRLGPMSRYRLYGNGCILGATHLLPSRTCFSRSSCLSWLPLQKDRLVTRPVSKPTPLLHADTRPIRSQKIVTV